MRRLLLVLFLLLFLTGCTVATMTLADGTKITYFDFHPAGNAVDAEGVWEGVGRFKMDRDTEDSSKIAGAVAEAVIP